jgi:hypothetical protein
MPQPPHSQLTQHEDRMSLAILAIDQNQFKSVRGTAKTYNIVCTTLRRRHARIPSKHDCISKSKKLTKLEEEVIIQYSLDLDLRGFLLQLNLIRDIVNRLLAVYTGRQVDIQ